MMFGGQHAEKFRSVLGDGLAIQPATSTVVAVRGSWPDRCFQERCGMLE